MNSIEEILAKLRSGGYAFFSEAVTDLGALLQQWNPNTSLYDLQSKALNYLVETGWTQENFRTGGPGDTGGTGGVIAEPTGADQPDVAFPPTAREAALTRQEEENLPDVFSRYLQSLPQYQGAAGYAQRALEQRGPRAQAQYTLIGATQPAGSQQTFSQYLAGERPTSAQLSQQLGRVTDYLGQPVGETGLGYQGAEAVAAGAEPGVEDILRSLYGSETEAGRGRQFQASIQPLLTQTAPYFRQFLERGAGRRAEQFMAAQPQTDWLTEARRLGYFT